MIQRIIRYLCPHGQTLALILFATLLLACAGGEGAMKAAKALGITRVGEMAVVRSHSSVVASAGGHSNPCSSPLTKPSRVFYMIRKLP